MVERDVEVLAVGDGQVRLRALGSCRGCGGCGGRCGLLGLDAHDASFAVDRFPQAPVPGQRWRLSLDEAALLAAARRGYGRPLAGLIAGAAAGVALATGTGVPPDLGTLLGAGAGTLLGLRTAAEDPARARVLPCVSAIASPQDPAAAVHPPGPHLPEEPSPP